MNKHIAKLREQLVNDMNRLTAELSEIANAINAIDAMTSVREKPSNKRATIWTPERRAALSAKVKAKAAANPELYQERWKQMRAARRKNGAAGHPEATT